MKRAVFIDKDGTLLENVPYNTDVARIVFLPGAIEGLLHLQKLGFAIVVVTNQSGIARGLYTDRDVTRVENYLRSVLRRFEIRLAGFHFCPHGPDLGQGGCTCRKPQPGLLLAAAKEHGLRLEESWMIGDILDDVEAGHRAGCRSILVDNGNETEWLEGPARKPEHTCRTLLEAAGHIEQQTVAVPALTAFERLT